MGWIEDLLIIAGTSLDLFAVMACQGSLVQKVNKKQLLALCFAGALCQLVSFGAGFFLADFICRRNPVSNETLPGAAVAIAILFCLGARLVMKAVRNEWVAEHLIARMDGRKLLRGAVAVSLYTVLIGIAFGFLDTGLIPVLPMLLFITVVFIIAGVYTGYHFGFEQKRKAYTIGAVLLWIAGADVLVRVLYVF